MYIAETTPNGAPLSKKMRADSGNVDGSLKSNYLPFLSEEDKERLVAELSISSGTKDLETFFEETKILQRHLVGKSVEWQLHELKWLKEVSLLKY